MIRALLGWLGRGLYDRRADRMDDRKETEETIEGMCPGGRLRSQEYAYCRYEEIYCDTAKETQ